MRTNGRVLAVMVVVGPFAVAFGGEEASSLEEQCRLGRAEACRLVSALAPLTKTPDATPAATAPAAATTLSPPPLVEAEEKRDDPIEDAWTEDVPEPPAPARRAATPAVELRDDELKASHRPAGEEHSRWGFAMKLAGSLLLSSESGESPTGAAGAWVGARYALRDRPGDGSGFNYGFALLGGIEYRGNGPGQSASSGWAGGELRFELMEAGKTGPLEPFFRGYVLAGVETQLGGSLFEARVGAGIGLNWTPAVKGSGGGWGGWGGLGGGSALGILLLPALAGVVLFAIAPTVEVHYHVRSDGTSYPSIDLACGL